jgi:hypothetical protein
MLQLGAYLWWQGAKKTRQGRMVQHRDRWPAFSLSNSNAIPINRCKPGSPVVSLVQDKRTSQKVATHSHIFSTYFLSYTIKMNYLIMPFMEDVEQRMNK